MKIGIVINPSQNPVTGACASYGEMRQRAQVAEAAEFDSIWLYDHLLFRWGDGETGGIWECWTLLAALAEATQSVELGTLVLCTPFRNPALLAKMAHTLDEVSNGRLILGVGAGWHQPEFDAFGYSFERRVDRLEEALQILRPLLRGQRADLDGTHYQIRDCVIAPPGPRPEGIPLLVGAGQPRMLRLTATYADQWNTAWLGRARELGDRMAQMHRACADVGRDPSTLDVTVGVEIVVPELGEFSPVAEEPLQGSASDLATAFAEYEAAGVAHLIVLAGPDGLPAIEHVAEGLRLFRGR